MYSHGFRVVCFRVIPPHLKIRRRSCFGGSGALKGRRRSGGGGASLPMVGPNRRRRPAPPAAGVAAAPGGGGAGGGAAGRGGAGGGGPRPAAAGRRRRRHGHRLGDGGHRPGHLRPRTQCHAGSQHVDQGQGDQGVRLRLCMCVHPCGCMCVHSCRLQLRGGRGQPCFLSFFLNVS